MDTTLLAVFREVARLGSFTAAAQTLGYTQSAISRQISTLEGEFGGVLFDRLPRGVRLTDEGRSLIPHAEAVLDRLGAATDDLRALRDLAAGRLRVGAFPTADAALVPWAMAAFHTAHPAVTISLVEGLTRHLVDRLQSGDIDLAVVSSAPGADLDGVHLVHLLDDPMFVALPPGHPLTGRQVLRLSELADESWIAGNIRSEETLIGTGIRPRIAFVAQEWIAKQGLVAAGLGATLIPSLAAGAARRDIELVALHPEDAPVRSVYAATPHGLTRSPAVTTFLGCLHTAAARLRASLPD
jgi:DNA-binding transcriptional LysR family regulator